MQESIAAMLAKYETGTLEDAVHALREILQEIALLGLWRVKFFEKAAFYGGTALRVLHGLDRYSEDLDFSLLEPSTDFDLGYYGNSLREEIQAFGFDVRVDLIDKAVRTPIQSAFLKTNTQNELLVIQAPEEIARRVPRGQVLKVKLEVDTDPPPAFSTQTHFLLQPVPFPVRAYALPDLFAGKTHAILCRRWKNRVKGRDWYDLVWFVTNHPQLHLFHLEQRMRQTGHWTGDAPFSEQAFRALLQEVIDNLEIEQARREVMPFVKHPENITIWSREFFADIARRIEVV